MKFSDILNNTDLILCKFNFAAFLRALLLLNPIILLFYTENGLSVRELFFFQGIFYLTSILFEIPAGYFSDFVSKKSALLTSYLFFVSTMLLWIFFHGYFIILLGEILLAVSKVIMDNTHSGYLYDYLNYKNKPDKMSGAYGNLNFFLAAGTTIGAIVGTYLYSTFGSKSNLYIEVIITVICVIIISSLPKVYHPSQNKHKIQELVNVTKVIWKNNTMMYYIYYSGFLTAFSVLFALSFQPVLLKAACPIVLFGAAAFFNHSFRAIFSALTSKFARIITLRNMIIPLYILYLVAFGFIFVMLYTKNFVVLMSIILIICIIIGFQLMFTIRQVSRLHKFVNSEFRGTAISVNNLFSRLTTFVVLFLSKLFMDKLGFENFYLIMFAFFAVSGLILTIKTFSVKEECL